MPGFPYRSATACLMASAMVFLSVLSTAALRSSSLFAVLAAATMAAWAAVAILAVRGTSGRGRWFALLGAVGGLVLLFVGIQVLVGKLSGVASLARLSLSSLSIAMPIAVVALLIGGVSQIPWRMLLVTLLSVIGPPGVAWFLLTGSALQWPLAFAAIADLSILALLVLAWLQRHHGWPGWFLAAGACGIALIVLALQLVGFTGRESFSDSRILGVAWAYLLCAHLCAAAGMLLRR